MFQERLSQETNKEEILTEDDAIFLAKTKIGTQAQSALSKLKWFGPIKRDNTSETFFEPLGRSWKTFQISILS